MIEHGVRIKSKHGLHARPSKAICVEAKLYDDTLVYLIDPLTLRLVNAKSVLEIMTLALGHGSMVIVRAEGPHEEQIVRAVTRIIKTFDIDT